MGEYQDEGEVVSNFIVLLSVSLRFGDGANYVAGCRILDSRSKYVNMSIDRVRSVRIRRSTSILVE